MPLKNSCSTHARWSKSSLKHSIRFCGIFPSLKQHFIAYRSSKVSWRPDCIFEIHQLWPLGISRVYSNCCCSCWYEPEIQKIGQSSHKMYCNKYWIFKSLRQFKIPVQKVWKLIEGTTYIYIIYIRIPTESEVVHLSRLLLTLQVSVFRNTKYIEHSYV